MHADGGSDTPERQGQMQDQDEFGEDPRGHDLSDQQRETQPAEPGAGGQGADPEDEGGTGQAERDDGGQATGNPASAG